MFKTDLEFKDSEVVFVNFFRSTNEDENSDRVDALECELDKEYTTYDLCSSIGIQKRMDYAAKNSILYCQLGNTSTYLMKDIDTGTIYGFNYSIPEILEESQEVGIEQACKNFKEGVGYNDSDYSDKDWHTSWKKGIDDTCDLSKKLSNINLISIGSICNEVWRIMATEPSTMKKYNLKSDPYNKDIKTSIEPGRYTLESDYSDDNPIYFTLSKI